MSIRLGCAALVVAFAPVLTAHALLGEWELDYENIADKGQRLLDQLAPESFRERYRFYTAEELADAFSPLQHALDDGSLEALAAFRPRARETLESLRANPETQGYADWLEARMDFFDMAAEVEQAIPAPSLPAPPPSVQPPQPTLPPHPGEPSHPLPPHPAPPQPPLVPHPAEPDRPARLPRPAPPPTAPVPHPVEPPAAPPRAIPPAVEKARNQYVESKQVWVRKLAQRPPPARAAAMVPDLKRIFREEGVPPQFVWQAEAESTFNPAARSPAGAVGLYQFMPATAQQFGLRLSPEDERLDALKNARAAARYLKQLHGRFGDWPLAFAAYNCGQGRVANALRATGGTTFDDIHARLPAETRMYVPKIAALVHLRENADLEGL